MKTSAASALGRVKTWLKQPGEFFHLLKSFRNIYIEKVVYRPGVYQPGVE